MRLGTLKLLVTRPKKLGDAELFMQLKITVVITFIAVALTFINRHYLDVTPQTGITLVVQLSVSLTLMLLFLVLGLRLTAILLEDRRRTKRSIPSKQ